MAITQEQAQSVSSNAQRLLLRGENMDVFTTAYNDQWIDPLSPRIISILDRMRNLEQYKYVGGKPITTVSFELYGTTSAWWIILYVNGYMHGDEIADGTTLKVPRQMDIDILLQETAKNNKGKVIRT